jgi:hypothetical protein
LNILLIHCIIGFGWTLISLCLYKNLTLLYISGKIQSSDIYIHRRIRREELSGK